MDLDYLDIYDDLDAFQKTEEKKSTELRELENKFCESIKSVETLQLENADLKKRIERIRINFQNLLDTAKAEIKRKDKQIEQLRKEKDDICFRRTRPRKESSDFSGANHTTNNWYKNHSEFPELDYKTTANEHPQRNPFQDHSVTDFDQPSSSKSQHYHEGHNVSIPNETHKYARRNEKSERKYETESKREKNPRDNSPTDEHNLRYRGRSRVRDRNGRAPTKEYNRSRNRSREHSRREERDHRNQKFDDYNRRHHSHEKYSERSRYSGQDTKTRFDNQEYNRERRSDFKKFQHGDNKDEYKANHIMENSKKGKIETSSKSDDDPNPSNLFRGKSLKTGERDIVKYDKALKSNGNSAEITARKILPEKKLSKESLLGLETNSGHETNNNGMTTPKRTNLLDKLFGETPKNAGSVNIVNEQDLAKSNISSATTSPSKYTDTSDQTTKSPATHELNSNIDDCSTDSNKEFDFRYLQINKLKPKDCAEHSALIKSFASNSTKKISNNVNTNVGSEGVISQSADEDYFEINKTNANKNVIDMEKPALDKGPISSILNLGAVQILQNIRVPNIYELRAYQRRLREEAAATENSKRESIPKMKDAELNATETTLGTSEKTASIIVQNHETVSKAESNKVVIAKEVLGEADINDDKNIQNEKLETVTIKDGSKNSKMAANANDLEKTEMIADTKSSANPNKTVSRVPATLEEEINCELKNEEVIIEKPIPESTSTETSLGSEVSSSTSAAEKSVVLVKQLDKIATGNTSYGVTETVLQNVKTVVEKASIINKTKADIECNGQSVVENKVIEAESKCSSLHINSPTENVEAAACIVNYTKLSDNITVSESNADSLITSKKPQQPIEDIKIISNNCLLNGQVKGQQLSCNSNSCVDKTVINALKASGENTKKPMALCDGKTKELTEEFSINTNSNDSAKNNKPTCDINNCVDTTVINVPEASGQLLDLYGDKTKATVKDVKSHTIDLLVDKNCEKETNEEEAQRERNKNKYIGIFNENVRSISISRDQLVKVDDRIQSDKNVINEEHISIAEQKTIDQRIISDESKLPKSEKINCKSIVKEHSNVAKTESGDTVSSEISMNNATMDAGSITKPTNLDHGNLKLSPKPVIINQTPKKVHAELTNTVMCAAALEKSVNGTCVYSSLIENVKRSEIMWKFKIPKIRSKRKRDDESEVKNIEKIERIEIDERVATKVEEVTNKVEEATNTLSKKTKKEDKIVKLQAREIVRVPDVSAKIERERLLKDETKAEKQRLLEQEKSRRIIKEIDNWARRKVGEATETIENEKQLHVQHPHQISETVSVHEERPIKTENILPKSNEERNDRDSGSNGVEKTSVTERYGKYNKEEMKCNVDPTRTTDYVADNRTKCKPQHHKQLVEVDDQRVLCKEKLEDNESAEHCFPVKKNELENVLIVKENTKEKTDIPKLSNNNNSESKSRNKSPQELPLSTIGEIKHATKISQQHKNQLTEEPKARVEATSKSGEHKAKLLERRKSQNSEEKTLSKTMSYAHETSSKQKQKSESEIEQKKTQIKKVKSKEEEIEKGGQLHVLKAEKSAQKDEQSFTSLTSEEIENKVEQAKLESSLAKETHSAHQTTHMEKSTEVQQLRKEHLKINSKKRKAQKTSSVSEVKENEICEKRAKIEVVAENIGSIENVYDREAHFTASMEVVTTIHDSHSTQIANTCSDTIKGKTEGEEAACSLPKETKRRRSITVTDANLSSEADVCKEQLQQRKIKILRTRIDDSDDDKASVDAVTSTQAVGLEDLHVDNQHKNDDILDILQNDRAIDTMSESLPAPQTPTYLPANISQDSKYEEIDSRMQLIFASPKVSEKTSTLSAIDKQNSAASNSIKVLQPVASQPTEESVNGGLDPMPIPALAPPSVVNAALAVAGCTRPVVIASPPTTATVQITDFSVSDTILSDITTNSFHTSSTNLTVDETDQSTMNMNSSLSDSNASTKHISLGSSDYRFEKVSENVVNLFITRKRRGKRKPNASTAITDTISTI